MSQKEKPETNETLSEQKERVLRECREYRAGATTSRRVVSERLTAEAIGKTVLALVSVRARSMVSKVSGLLALKNMSGAKMQRFLPLVVSGVSLLSKRSVLKPMVMGAGAIGAVATALVYFSRRKAKKAATRHVALHEHL